MSFSEIITVIATPLHAGVSFVLDPLLVLPPVLAIAIIAFCASVIVILASKYLTNQTLMKSLKEEIDALNKQMRELRDHPDRMMEVQKRFTEVQLKYMTQSMRTSFFTLIPLLLIVSWLNAHYAFIPYAPGSDIGLTVQMLAGATGYVEIKDIVPDGLELSSNATQDIVNNQASFQFKAKDPGDYTVTLEQGGSLIQRSIIVSNGHERRYAVASQKENAPFQTTMLAYPKYLVIPLGFWNWLGALGTYILFSLIFSLSMRKFFKVY